VVTIRRERPVDRNVIARADVGSSEQLDLSIDQLYFGSEVVVVLCDRSKKEIVLRDQRRLPRKPLRERASNARLSRERRTSNDDEG
jgi:hypothetical protein